MTHQLTTRRLSLRIISLADLDFVHALHSLPETDEFNTLGIPATIEETLAVVNGWLDEYRQVPPQAYTFVIDSTEHTRQVGLIGIRLGKPKYRIAEVWFKLHKDEWGKGYGTEALEAVIGFGFGALGLHRIEAGCAAANTGSARVMEKAGMLREGMRRKTLPLKSGWADNYIYGILESDPWPRSAQ